MGVGLEVLFSYIHNVMAEAFKATKTVMKGKVEAAVEKGLSGGWPYVGGGNGAGVKNVPTAPVNTS